MQINSLEDQDPKQLNKHAQTQHQYNDYDQDYQNESQQINQLPYNSRKKILIKDYLLDRLYRANKRMEQLKKYEGLPVKRSKKEIVLEGGEKQDQKAGEEKNQKDGQGGNKIGNSQKEKDFENVFQIVYSERRRSRVI